jgi:hypothetical protein
MIRTTIAVTVPALLLLTTANAFAALSEPTGPPALEEAVIAPPAASPKLTASALQGADGTVSHSAHDFGVFANVSVGYAFDL